MIIISYKCAVSAVCKSKMTCYGDDSLFPDNSSPMQMKLNDFISLSIIVWCHLSSTSSFCSETNLLWFHVVMYKRDRN